MFRHRKGDIVWASCYIVSFNGVLGFYRWQSFSGVGIVYHPRFPGKCGNYYEYIIKFGEHIYGIAKADCTKGINNETF
jgi:hypothetical protein